MTRTKKQHSKAYKVVNIIFTLVLLLVLIVLSINAIWSTLDKSYVFSIFGYQFYTVVTDSMVANSEGEFGIPVGSLVVSKSLTKKTQLKSGDIITFNTKNEFTGERMVVTHYFREIVQAEDGRYQYVTYSNKDLEQDSFFVELSDIRGVYVSHAPWMGKVALFLKSPIAMVMYVVILIIVIGASFLVKKTTNGSTNKPNGADDDQDNSNSEGQRLENVPQGNEDDAIEVDNANATQ